MRLKPKRTKIDLAKKGFRDELISSTPDELFSDNDSELTVAREAALKKVRLFAILLKWIKQTRI